MPRARPYQQRRHAAGVQEIDMRALPFLAAGFIAATASAPLLAHPKLLSSTPAAESTVAPLSRIEVAFSEKLVPQFTGATLARTDMPGMPMHAPMQMKVASSVDADGTRLVVTTSKPLPKGSYKLSYHVVSTDTHRVEGGFGFKVQ